MGTPRTRRRCDRRHQRQLRSDRYLIQIVDRPRSIALGGHPTDGDQEHKRSKPRDRDQDDQVHSVRLPLVMTVFAESGLASSYRMLSPPALATSCQADEPSVAGASDG
jgi:hypothetical protein